MKSKYEPPPAVAYGEVVVHVHTHPDDQARVRFTAFWKTDYIPGNPDPTANVRGQVFFAVLGEHVKRWEANKINVKVVDRT